MIEEQTKQRKRASKAAATISAYRRLFSTDDGKIVLADMMKSCHVSRSVVGPTPYDTYFNEGQRSVVLSLMGTAGMTEVELKSRIDAMNKEVLEDF